MQFSFEKWHGCKNNFAIFWVDGRDDIIVDSIVRSIPNIATKDGSGIGCDGVFVLRRKKGDYLPELVHLYNPDGSKMGTCGNGLRCIAASIIFNSLKSDPNSELPEDLMVKLENDSIHIKVPLVKKNMSQYFDFNFISVDMGSYSIGSLSKNENEFVAQFLPQEFEAVKVNFANPHLVIFVEDIKSDLIDVIGPAAQKFFAETNGINVHIALQNEPEASAKSHFKNRMGKVLGSAFDVDVWERGAGKTMACGSGASAVVAAAIDTHRADSEVWHQVNMPGGALYLHCDSNSATLTGPAKLVFEGTIDL